MNESVATSIDPAVIKELADEIGPTLVAVVSGTRRRQDAYDWTAGLALPSQNEYEHIAFALKVFRQIAESEGSDIARAWFLGENTCGRPPYDAIRHGLLDDTQASANRFIEGNF